MYEKCPLFITGIFIINWFDVSFYRPCLSIAGAPIAFNWASNLGNSVFRICSKVLLISFIMVCALAKHFSCVGVGP